MKQDSTIFGGIGSRLMLGLMIFLLALGTRAQVVIGNSLNLRSLQTQGPVHEEEEETRHEGKATKSAGEGRREEKKNVPAPSMLVVGMLPDGSRSARVSSIESDVAPEHESDFRNGIGAPLRC